MKDWKLLSTEELAALTPKEYTKYLKIICAENGIKYPQEPLKPQPINLIKDKIVYQINMIDNVLFEDFNEAKKIADSLSSCESIGYASQGFSYSQTCFHSQTPQDYNGVRKKFDVQTIEIFSQEYYNNNIARFRNNKEAIDKYNLVNDEYKKELKAFEEFTRDFIDKVKHAKEVINHRNYLRDLYYHEYLPLADGDATIAMNFLKKVESVNDEDEKYINSKEESEC